MAEEVVPGTTVVVEGLVVLALTPLVESELVAANPAVAAPMTRALAKLKTCSFFMGNGSSLCRQIAEAKLNSDAFFGPQNLKYLAQGTARDIAPVAASDNGRLTAFRYPGNLGFPAIFVVQDAKPGIPDVCTTGHATDNGAPEQTVQATIDGDLIVVQRTAAHFRLREGRDVIEIYNCGYDPIGQNPGTGTSSPDVVRRVITAR